MRIPVVVIGAGPAGLATSWHLTRREIPHVVVERGRVAERWRSERWDSLRLLTPNRHARLPGWEYAGPDTSGFMSMGEVVDWLAAYSAATETPVLTNTSVNLVSPSSDGFVVETDRITFESQAVVVATGAEPWMPRWRDRISSQIEQRHSSEYRNPDHLPPGGVLVVGASASGIQIAAELAAVGRRVTLSVGSHNRLPRTYRGRDIHWWLDLSGKLDVTIDQVANAEAARRSPSLQLVGSPEGQSLDLNVLSEAGVRLTGRARAASGTLVRFALDLRENCERADRRQLRLLDEFDSIATAAGYDDILATPYRPLPTRIPASPRSIDLDRAGIRSILWATGFAPSYPWLALPVVDGRGRIRHHAGVADWPGLYVMGLPFMRRRRSTFLDGFDGDADAIVSHLADHLKFPHAGQTHEGALGAANQGGSDAPH